MKRVRGVYEKIIINHRHSVAAVVLNECSQSDFKSSTDHSAYAG